MAVSGVCEKKKHELIEVLGEIIVTNNPDE
jgi:hypothetical protein